MSRDDESNCKQRSVKKQGPRPLRPAWGCSFGGRTNQRNALPIAPSTRFPDSPCASRQSPALKPSRRGLFHYATSQVISPCRLAMLRKKARIARPGQS